MKKSLSGIMLFLITLFPTYAFCDAFNPPPGEWKLSGPAIVGSLTILPVGNEPCVPGDGVLYVDTVTIAFLGKCKGQSVLVSYPPHGIKICFENLVADDLEGLVLTDYDFLPPDCSPHGGPGPLIINSVTKFEAGESMILADVVFLFLVPAN